MKITADFLGARPRLAAPLAATLWLSAFACLALAGWLALRAADLRAERPRLELRLERVQAQVAAAAPGAPLPAAPQLASLRERVRALNKVSGLRGWNTPQLLDWLGARLPDNVHLVSLHHRPREGEALLLAASPSAEALTGFLLSLEKEPRFAEVLLSKQGTAPGPGAGDVQFEIRIRWKS
jgi:hypothetical protein